MKTTWPEPEIVTRNGKPVSVIILRCSIWCSRGAAAASRPEPILWPAAIPGAEYDNLINRLF